MQHNLFPGYVAGSVADNGRITVAVKDEVPTRAELEANGQIRLPFGEDKVADGC